MAYTLLFPGQGSQQVGMGADFIAKFDLAKKRFAQANEIVGRDIQTLCLEGPREELTATRNTQPALFTVESVCCDLLKENGIEPACVLGHSLGEYAALYAAGVFSFEDGLRVVARRGELMARAGEKNPGTMAAVLGLEKQRISDILAQVGSGVVAPANENSPEQTVISGEIPAVNEACEKLIQAGAKRVVPLPVSGAFHSPLMQDAADELAAVLGEISLNRAVCPIVCNVTADERRDPDELRELLVKQLTAPVRWSDSMAYIESRDLTSCIEAGPGAVLKGLARKTSKSINVVPCGTVDNLYSLLNSHE
jgi:[acyl-carrier-protein] S-malonyltransferase